VRFTAHVTRSREAEKTPRKEDKDQGMKKTRGEEVMGRLKMQKPLVTGD
jgi:hypothetical protein